ncbi:hypothetical protein F5Y09DRAFT_320136 [Xylaria sp. FL1042]|nr:hypothetical protein F5Y09DRAFT_320136 [Xylaria sp. FL1042]
MGIDEGFDMVPRLTGSSEDVRRWKEFIDVIRVRYQSDDKVNFKNDYIEFNVGEHPMLPLDGQKFLRFSSKLTSDDIWNYLQTVRRIAKSIFGNRVRPWSQALDQFGFYDWRDVYQTQRFDYKSYIAVTTPRFVGDGPDYPIDDRMFEALEIPGKGKGLVARCNIRSGTRILCEKPLFILRNEPLGPLHRSVASKLNSLSREEQRLFLSLHNNFPGQYAFAGIIKTNALPCGPGASTGGIYLEISRINHSCLPNCSQSWNDEIKCETIHAVKTILAGEELTIHYDRGGPALTRQVYLQSNFGFNCKCELCTLPHDELQASDSRRRRIQELDGKIGDPQAMMTEPLLSLQACQALFKILVDEYGTHDMALVPRVYYDAFQIVISHGDQARAAVFAERAYKARVACEGEDSPATKKVKDLMQNPSSHYGFARCSKKWKSSKTAQPKNLSVDEFEKWLWHTSG